MNDNNATSNLRRSILYVEDDAAVVELFRIALADLDLLCVIELVTAKDAAEALSILRTSQPTTGKKWPDLVLLDLHLPQRDGISLLRELRAIDLIVQVPVVFFTASTDRREESAALQSGATAFLHKPTDYVGFVDSVRSACTYLQKQGG